MSARHLTVRILFALGLALLAGGLLLGFLPHSAPGAYGSLVACGSAFRGSDDAAVDDIQSTLQGGPASLGPSPLGSASSACSAARSNARAPAVVLLVLAAGLVLAGLVVLAPHDPPRADRPDTNG